MRSYSMLETIPANGQPGARRFYIDGRRVTFAQWWRLESRAARVDSFATACLGGRWHFRKEARA